MRDEAWEPEDIVVRLGGAGSEVRIGGKRLTCLRVQALAASDSPVAAVEIVIPVGQLFLEPLPDA